MNIVILLNIVTIFLRITSGLIIINCVMSKSKLNIKEIIIGLICSIAIPIASNYPGDIFPSSKGSANSTESRLFFCICAEVLCIWFCGLFFKKTDRRTGLFASVFYEIAIHLISILTGALFVIATKDTDFINPFSFHGSIAFLIAGLIIGSCSIIFLLLRNVSTHTWLRLISGLALFSIFLINYISTFNLSGMDKETVNSWIYYAAFLFCSVLVIQMKMQYETEKELAEMKTEEALILEREYHSLNQSYETNAKLFHDFRNHCGVLKNYLLKDKADEALKYLEELTGDKSSLSTEVWTGDETVDYLIGNKKSLAEGKGIVFEAQVEFPRNMNIKSSDLCAILGNLLDNAIEASSKVRIEDNRKVRLIIRRIQQMLVIKVENTYEYKPIENHNEKVTSNTGNVVYRTSKTDGGLHGWGIKSARTAAERYDGTIQSSFTDELFTTVVTLSFEGVNI